VAEFHREQRDREHREGDDADQGEEKRPALESQRVACQPPPPPELADEGDPRGVEAEHRDHDRHRGDGHRPAAACQRPRECVRHLAAEAGVTERTFYRYFGDKSALVADELLAWLGRLGEEIVARPADKSDLEAVEAAVLKLVRRSGGEAVRLPVWIGDGPRRALQVVRPSIPRPLLRVEQSIAAALATRAEAAGREPDPFRDLVVARVCVAVLRSALLSARDEDGDPKPGRLATFLKRGFAVVGEVASTDGADADPG
jgi:AcrR family transcriptional regulator